MNILNQSLGLDKVEADVNAIPDGKYDGVVFRSVLVYKESDDSLSHVIEYKVTDGDYSGKKRSEWFTMGTEPRIKDAETGEPVAPAKGEVNLSDLISFTPGMSEVQKPWYVKRHTDLGIEESEVVNARPEDLVGKPVTFGVKRNGTFININFVELRAEDTNGTGPVSLTGDADPGF